MKSNLGHSSKVNVKAIFVWYIKLLRHWTNLSMHRVVIKDHSSCRTPRANYHLRRLLLFLWRLLLHRGFLKRESNEALKKHESEKIYMVAEYLRYHSKWFQQISSSLIIFKNTRYCSRVILKCRKHREWSLDFKIQAFWKKEPTNCCTSATSAMTGFVMKLIRLTSIQFRHRKHRSPTCSPRMSVECRVLKNSL